jgi:hypothetical protein
LPETGGDKRKRRVISSLFKLWEEALLVYSYFLQIAHERGVSSEKEGLKTESINKNLPRRVREGKYLKG